MCSGERSGGEKHGRGGKREEKGRGRRKEEEEERADRGRNDGTWASGGRARQEARGVEGGKKGDLLEAFGGSAVSKRAPFWRPSAACEPQWERTDRLLVPGLVS